MIFDTHAHYDDRQFEGDREELLGSMPENGVELIVDAGSDIASWDKIEKLTDRYPFVYGAIGVHPDEVGELDEEKMQRMEWLLAKEKMVAVGEIGLDYYWDKENRDLQKMWFIRQLELARQLDLGIGGVVTFKNAKKLKEVVQEIPLEALVLETDSPYLAPVPNRGKRNSSLNLVYVAEEIAGLKGISYEEVVRQTTENAKKLYRLEK